jgi:type IV pilus assembly protein PilW
MKRHQMISIQNNTKGFTFIELMVAMAIGMIVMAVIYSTYESQQKSYVTQQLVVDMEQNARAAMSLMKREIRMTGFDPRASNGIDDDGLNGIDDGAEASGATVVKAGKDWIQFTADLNADGDTDDANEDITYYCDDTDADGICDTLTWQRVSTAGGTAEDLAYDIEAVGFAYAFDDDGDDRLDTIDGDPAKPVIWAIRKNPSDTQLGNNLDTDENGVIDAGDVEGGQDLPHQVDFDRIRMVKIWLLARTRQPVRGHKDNQTYVVGWQHITTNDNYRRCLLTATVQCRNMVF